MNCVNYICTQEVFRPALLHAVRWLDWDEDYTLARDFWPPHIGLSLQDWLSARDEGYRYCAVVEDGGIVSMAAVLRYSEPEWMLAAVMTKPETRRCGYGKSVCTFATAHILDAGRVATTTTEVTNIAMRKTAESIGYQQVA